MRRKDIFDWYKCSREMIKFHMQISKDVDKIVHIFCVIIIGISQVELEE